MKTLGKTELYAYFDDNSTGPTAAAQADIWRGPGHPVISYTDLLCKLAEVQYLNPDYVLMLRGQKVNYTAPLGHSLLKPSIFRSKDGKYPGQQVLRDRFARLRFAEKALVGNADAYLFHDPIQRIKRFRIIRWAILQHYEVLETPLLDVTTSVRISASFACSSANSEAFVFVLAVPNVSSAVTSSAEAGIQIIRLASVCPPGAMRPHVQEGYLLGEFPEIDTFEQKENFAYGEVDFGSRLISKFRIDPHSFWHNEYFPRVPTEFLYPSAENDPFLEVVQHVKRDLLLFPNLPTERYHLGASVFDVVR